MKVDCHEDQMNTQLNDMIVQTSAMFKGNDKLLPFIYKNDSLPIFTIMIDECLFSVLRVQGG